MAAPIGYDIKDENDNVTQIAAGAKIVISKNVVITPRFN